MEIPNSDPGEKKEEKSKTAVSKNFVLNKYTNFLRNFTITFNLYYDLTNCKEY